MENSSRATRTPSLVTELLVALRLPVIRITGSQFHRRARPVYYLVNVAPNFYVNSYDQTNLYAPLVSRHPIGFTLMHVRNYNYTYVVRKRRLPFNRA